MWARLVILATAVVIPAGSDTILAQVDGARLRLKFPAGHARNLLIQIIHELLHSLGLGEHPPAADQITKQVVRRCGR